MKSVDYIISENFIHVIVNGNGYIIDKSEPEFDTAISFIEQEDFQSLGNLVDKPKLIATYTFGKVQVFDDAVLYNGEQIEDRLVDKILDFARKGRPYERFVKFIDHVMKNTRENSRKQLFDFLEDKSLILDEDGMVLGYKGVREDYYSVNGNEETKVIKGLVNSEYQIRNKVGDVIEVEPSCVVNDPQRHCAEGLHIGNYEYASNWSKRVMLVRFSPEHAVSVPIHEKSEKLRVYKYEVVAEMKQRQKITKINNKGKEEEEKESHEIQEEEYYKNEKETLEKVCHKPEDSLVLSSDKVYKYVVNFIQKKEEFPTIGQIQKRFKKEKPTVKQILDLVNGSNKLTLTKSKSVTKSLVGIVF